MTYRRRAMNLHVITLKKYKRNNQIKDNHGKIFFHVAMVALFFVFASRYVESKMDGLNIPGDGFDLTDTQDTFQVIDYFPYVPNDMSGLSDSKDTFQASDDYSGKVPPHTREILSQLSDHQDIGLIITYKKGVSFKRDGLIEEKLGRIGVAKARGKKADIPSFIDDPYVKSIEVDQPMIFAAEQIPWNVDLTNTPLAWNFTKGSGVPIAILDSGISPHPDLQLSGGVSVIGGDYSDTYGHGTAVAGVISAVLNDEGLIGVAPEADIYAVKITDGPTGMISDALAGLDWAITNNMAIISMSFGFNEYSPAFASALRQAYANGALLIAAAGNDDSEVLFPARYDEVIAVGSIDSSLQRAPSSNHGPWLELVAPGVAINTTWANERYAMVSGTSLATPHIVGVTTLIKSQHPEYTNTELRNALHNAAQDLGETGRDDYYGYGLAQYTSTPDISGQEEPIVYYTIYNLAYLGEQEQLTFWKNGTGNYQQENFSMGLYLINITRGINNWVEKINVSDEGTIILLTESISLTDAFDVDSSTLSDGVEFKDDATITATMIGELSSTDAYCFNFDMDDNIPDACGYKDENALTACVDWSEGLEDEGYYFYLACPDGILGSCDLDETLDLSHDATTSTTIKHKNLGLIAYRNCANTTSRSTWTTYGDTYIIDTRRAKCTSSSQYRMEGRYTAGGAYVVYKTGFSCSAGTTCDESRDDEITTTNRSTAINPCRLNEAESCTATEQCLNGLNCTSNVCTNETSSNSIDLRVLEVLPVQVVPHVPLVKGKTGIVRVLVANNGTLNATGEVNVTLNGDLLNPWPGDNSSKFILANQTAIYNFQFKPTSTGTALFNAKVTIK